MSYKKYLFKVLFILNLAAVISVSMLPGSSFTNEFLFSWDKLAHFSEYFILIALYILMRKSCNKPLNILHLVLLIICLPIAQELHQKIIPGRSYSIYDIAADICGSVSALGIHLIFKKKAEIIP